LSIYNLAKNTFYLRLNLGGSRHLYDTDGPDDGPVNPVSLSRRLLVRPVSSTVTYIPSDLVEKFTTQFTNLNPNPDRIMELSFPRTFALKSESTIGGTFAPWNFRSLELSLPGTFAPGSESYMELSLPGTFVPWNFRPCTNTRNV